MEIETKTAVTLRNRSYSRLSYGMVKRHPPSTVVAREGYGKLFAFAHDKRLRLGIAK